MASSTPSPIDLSLAAQVFWNPPVDVLIEHALTRDHCELASNGAVVARSGKYTGRTPRDKYVVRDSLTEDKVWWENNNAMSAEGFAAVGAKLQEYAVGKDLYVIDTFGGADTEQRIAVRFIVERPYHALFIKQLLIRPTAEDLATYQPDWTVVDLGKRVMDPATEPVHGDAVIALSFTDQQVLIAGTEYAGEMKKSVFTIMNFLLPLRGHLSMHCSANTGPEGDTCLFFGLSGTGKTTLSADHDRRLIGDDEHGWTDRGVFNIEGGCYAKCIKLSAEGEPEIWNAIRHGSVLENVVLGPDGVPDYNDVSLTENTRCAYPIDFIEGAVQPSLGGHPKNIIFLTCDALGVLPPISRLTPDQAMFHFLNGYTAKVAGTEAGVTEPTLTFSACFGQPFLPLAPKVYAKRLGELIAEHEVRVWLVNTGWTGGGYGVGHRMKLGNTRAMIRAALAGHLEAVGYSTDPIFGLAIPNECPGVDSELLTPRNTWADPEAYDREATKLAARFHENHKLYE
ncbi:MAG: phosphoenolpyruvate carboxykinase (ATP) [Fimbriimonas sp.]